MWVGIALRWRRRAMESVICCRSVSCGGLAYILDPKAWMRVALLVVAVPLAIVANAVRVPLRLPSRRSIRNSPLDRGSGDFLLCLAALAGARQLFHAVTVRHHA